MKPKISIVALALVLAATATMAMFLYLRGIQSNAGQEENQISVVVAMQDIPAQTNLDDVLSGGGLSVTSVPESIVVDGALRDLSSLEGQTTVSPVLEGEQISTARLEGSKALPGGVLGIPKGHVALSVPLMVSEVVAGAVEPGDHVTIYGSFNEPQPGVTVTLAADAQVLDIVGEPPVQEAGAVTTTTKLSTVELNVALALKPNESQKLVFGQEKGTVWMALIPPGEKGHKESPVSLGTVAR